MKDNMKTIKQLEKGCGIAKLNPNKREETVILCGRDEELCYECKAKIQTLKDVLKLINKVKKGDFDKVKLKNSLKEIQS